MRRREILGVLCVIATWPLAAHAQQAGKVHRIGFLGSATAAGSAKEVESLRTGLRELGYVEGTNVAIEFRWAEGIYDRLPYLVAELIATNVDVLITHGTPGTRVAKQATTTIPIVMAISGDAIATGLVSSLARPEANLTGSTFFLPQLNAKRLELLKEACPRISRAAALSNPDNPVSRPIIPAMQAAAASLSLIVEAVRAQSPSEFSLAFADMAKSRVDSVVVTEEGEFAASFRAIAALALANKLPSIGAREYAEAGGLIGYGVNILALYRRAAYFVDRILKGAKPADLPIEQPTKFELIVNLKTAKTLGLRRIRRDRCASSSTLPPAAPPTSPRVSSVNGCPSGSASNSSSKIGPEQPPISPPKPSCVRPRTAIRCSLSRRRMPSTPRSTTSSVSTS